MKVIFYLIAILLLIALAPLPIGYYTFLRIGVTFASVVIISKEYKEGLSSWLLFFGGLAILFNPIFPIYLNQKSFWMPIDIVAAILFISYSFKKA